MGCTCTLIDQRLEVEINEDAIIELVKVAYNLENGQQDSFSIPGNNSQNCSGGKDLTMKLCPPGNIGIIVQFLDENLDDQDYSCFAVSEPPEQIS